MRSNRLSIAMTVAVAALCSAVFVTPTHAAGPQEKILHNFNGNGKDGIGSVSDSFGRGKDGEYPTAGVIFDAAGNL